MVEQLQAELRSCRDQMGVHGQAVAAMAAERDACRASADESSDRAKVRGQVELRVMIRVSATIRAGLFRQGAKVQAFRAV